MSDLEKITLKSKLNELSDRLSAREAELRKYTGNSPMCAEGY